MTGRVRQRGYGVACRAIATRVLIDREVWVVEIEMTASYHARTRQVDRMRDSTDLPTVHMCANIEEYRVVWSISSESQDDRSQGRDESVVHSSLGYDVGVVRGRVAKLDVCFRATNRSSNLSLRSGAVVQTTPQYRPRLLAHEDQCAQTSFLKGPVHFHGSCVISAR